MEEVIELAIQIDLRCAITGEALRRKYLTAVAQHDVETLKEILAEYDETQD